MTWYVLDKEEMSKSWIVLQQKQNILLKVLQAAIDLQHVGEVLSTLVADGSPANVRKKSSLNFMYLIHDSITKREGISNQKQEHLWYTKPRITTTRAVGSFSPCEQQATVHEGFAESALYG